MLADDAEQVALTSDVPISDWDLAMAVRGLGDAVLLVDRSGQLKWANAAAERLFGWPLDDWIGTSGLDLIHPDDLDLALVSLTSVQGKDVGTPIELRLRTVGGWRLVELIGAPLGTNTDGTLVLSVRDLTERRRWEVAGDEVARFRSLMHNAATVTMFVSPVGEVEAVSGALTRLLGQDPEMVQGRPLAELVDPRDRPVLAAAFHRSLSESPRDHGSSVTVEVRLLRRIDDTSTLFELTIVNLLDDPTVGGFVISGHDITRLRVAREQLQRLANCDGLTGLPNRAALDRQLAIELAGARQSGAAVAVIFLDLDRFKPINDLLGHGAGDELLRHLSARLEREVAEGDFVARFGGDEFVVLHVGPESAAGLAERLEEVVAEPFQLASGPAQVFASVGVATAQPDHTVEALLSEADAHMYAVKRSRRGNPLAPVMALGERRRLAEQLAVALTDNQLVVHYQPIVDLTDGTVVGLEGLIRWQHPERGLLRPAAFLGVAEDAGRERELGELVLHASCAHLARLDEAAPERRLSVSVNVSAAQLTGDGFVHLVEEKLHQHGLAPERLCLEISERSILERPAHGPATPVRVTLDALAELGVRLAIDDFGTGYSSLTHVLQFPVHILKIDQSFVLGVASDRQRRSVVAAVIELARGMGIEAIAEGIERRDQLRALQALGCPFGQGYLLGRPAPAGIIDEGLLGNQPTHHDELFGNQTVARSTSFS